MRAVVIAEVWGREWKTNRGKPKCLLKFGNKSLLQWTVEGLDMQDVKIFG